MGGTTNLHRPLFKGEPHGNNYITMETNSYLHKHKLLITGHKKDGTGSRAQRSKLGTFIQILAHTNPITHRS